MTVHKKDSDAIVKFVNRGIKVLDTQHPGWRQKINTGTLRLESGNDCVLGQMFGAYNTGLNVLWPDDTQETRDRNGRKHGFDLPTHSNTLSGEATSDEIWNELTSTWREVVETSG